VLAQLQKENPQDIQIIYHQFPLMNLTQDGTPFHDKAELASQAAEAAGAQGKFWEMHDLLYQQQNEWTGLSPAEFRPLLDKYAAQVGLDLPTFTADIGSEAIALRVKAAFTKATELGLQGTPSIFINGKPYQMAPTLPLFKFAIKLIKAGAFGSPPPETIDRTSPYTATLDTTKGKIIVALDAANAPQAVNSFIFLARQGWYDNVPFMVVMPRFAIVGGLGETNGFPGYTVSPENNQFADAATGMVGLFPLDQQGQYFGAMFFIAREVITSTMGLPFFGHVVGGQDVLAALTTRENPQAAPADILNSVTVEGPTVAPRPTPTPRPSLQWAEAPAMQIDVNKTYTATLTTAKGDIVIQLLPQAAPLTVNNFVFLARQGYYNGVTFHRVIPGFMAQGGDPTGTGMGGPGYQFPNEVTTTLKFDGPGLVAMANAGPNTNGSQFFITYAAAAHLDGQYSIFGKVISGMEAVLALTPRDPSMNPNAPPGDTLISVTIEEK
jgi:cyclophilin family peptidyl-prolyl cis-trans isomerase